MSDTVDDMEAYVKLKDSILDFIEQSDDPRLEVGFYPMSFDLLFFLSAFCTYKYIFFHAQSLAADRETPQAKALHS